MLIIERLKEGKKTENSPVKKEQRKQDDRVS